MIVAGWHCADDGPAPGAENDVADFAFEFISVEQRRAREDFIA
jgi:hypothetical protein